MRKLGKNSIGHSEIPDRIKRLICVLLLFIAFFGTVIVLDAVRCSNGFIVADYTVRSDKLTAGVKIAMLSDLHSSEFGMDNSDLVSAVKDISPDVIVCVGDMISRTANEEDLSSLSSLIEQLAGIAPVFASLGNHEDEYEKEQGGDITAVYEQAGATVLNKNCEEITVNGQSILIGGIYGYCFRYGLSPEAYKRSSSNRFLSAFCESEEFKLLLCHKPTDYYLESEQELFEDRDIDLILSGHTHGGLWRIPGIGGIYLPQQGFFPKLDHGLKSVGKAQMLIGAGLGHSGRMFRLNDPCELVAVELIPEG